MCPTNLLGHPIVAKVTQSLDDLTAAYPPTPGSRQPPTRPGVLGFGGYRWYPRPGAASSVTPPNQAVGGFDVILVTCSSTSI